MDQQRREQQADREIANTTFSRGVAITLLAMFLVVIVAVPIIDALRDPVPARGVMHLLPAPFEVEQSLSEEGLLAGSMALNRRLHQNMEQFEANLEQGAFLRDWFISPVNRTVTRALGGRNADVCAGREDWLFYGPAVDHLTGPPFQSQFPAGEDPLTVLANLHEDLAARGITLIVMPIPVKASVYPEKLSSRVAGDTPVFNPSHYPLLETLAARGVLVFDPSAALMEAKKTGVAYLAGDSHWTPHGQQAAIVSLAAFMRERLPSLPQESAGYGLAPSTDVTNRGDLVDLLEPGKASDSGEKIALSPVIDRDGAPWTPLETAPAMLLGDSFANIFQLEGMGWGTGSGMAAQLSYALQLPVDAITQNGDGAFATRLALNQELGRGRDRLAGKQALVFAFSARELSLGDWKPDLRLAEVKKPNEEPDSGASLTITATIADQSQPPEPGSVPYKDCIIATRLVDVHGAAGVPASIVVYRWGMRENRWTDATRQRSGEEVRITIQPWGDVAAALGSYNRMDLESEELLELPVWWESDYALGDEHRPPSVVAPTAQEAGNLGLMASVQALENAESLVHRGVDDWLFFLPELRFLAAGPFWGDSAATVSRASNPDFADPLPAIVDFHQQLETRGIELLLLPVPAKASVYDEETEISDLSGEPSGVREDFLEILEQAGVDVVNLNLEFMAERGKGDRPLYCRQDTHWSPYAITLAAQILAERIQSYDWHEDRTKVEYPVTEAELTIEGDLRAMLPEPRPEPEVVRVWRVGGDTPPPVDRDSPVLLIGDSHNLVFHDGGDMHDRGSGLPDHLAAELGYPVDLVAVRGSGATTPRINLARRRDNLAGKRVVIWCFTVREFTESNTGWRPIPVIN